MRALITGITGQDGSYLAELLLDKGYEVHGLVRRSSSSSEGQMWRLQAILGKLTLHEGDVIDSGSLVQVLAKVQPHEVYNLAAQSHVNTSFVLGSYTGEVNGLGAAKLIEACRQQLKHRVRYYQASSSEMFGETPPPQSEATPFHPKSPYAAAKLYAHWMCVNARDAYDMHCSNGILMNHESPRRGEQFVTRKISLGVARIKSQLRRGQSPEKLRLGNLDAKRDWGHARDYVRAMWLMLQQFDPDDYVVATGEAHTVRDLVTLAFDVVGLDWEEWVEIDPAFYRPVDVHSLRGDASKARKVLGWAPAVTFEQLVREMVESDLEQTQVGETQTSEGPSLPLGGGAIDGVELP